MGRGMGVGQNGSAADMDGQESSPWEAIKKARPFVVPAVAMTGDSRNRRATTAGPQGTRETKSYSVAEGKPVWPVLWGAGVKIPRLPD